MTGATEFYPTQGVSRTLQAIIDFCREDRHDRHRWLVYADELAEAGYEHAAAMLRVIVKPTDLRLRPWANRWPADTGSFVESPRGRFVDASIKAADGDVAATSLASVLWRAGVAEAVRDGGIEWVRLGQDHGAIPKTSYNPRNAKSIGWVWAGWIDMFEGTWHGWMTHGSKLVWWPGSMEVLRASGARSDSSLTGHRPMPINIHPIREVNLWNTPAVPITRFYDHSVAERHVTVTSEWEVDGRVFGSKLVVTDIEIHLSRTPFRELPKLIEYRHDTIEAYLRERWPSVDVWTFPIDTARQ